MKPSNSASTVLALLTLASTRLVAGNWPQWHGPTRDCRIASDDPAPASLPKDLKPVWKIPVGGGFSSPVVADGKLAYLDENGSQEVAHLIDAKTGKALWQTPLAARFEDEWGAGPRSTPFIDGDRVYAQSCNGAFYCLNLSHGKIIWGVNFEKDYGVKFLGSKANEGTATRRGNSGSCVVDGEEVIVPVGSTEGATLVCFNKLTGKEIWRVGSDEAAYSSPAVVALAGVRQVVYLSADSLMGADRASGKQLWRVPLVTNAKRHACAPVILGDTVTVNSHTFGTISFKITKEGGGFKAVELWKNQDLKTNLGTAAAVGDYLYNQGANKDFACFSAKTGELKWSQTGFGLGRKDFSSTIVAGKNLLVLTEDGTLLLLAANPEKYTELSRLQVCGNTWSFPAYAGGKLYVRDGRQLVCLDLLKSE